MKNLMILFAMIFTVSTFAQEAVKTNMSPARDYENYIVPGLGYGAYMPRDWKANGLYHGVTTEFTFYTATRPAYKGPGMFRVYGRFNLMQNMEDPDLGLMTYGVGTNLSFEREINRAAMIPYFGIEMGGLSRTDTGGAFQMSPLLGVNLVSTEHFNWYLQGGYTYATGRNFNTLSGGFASTGISVLFW